MGGGRGGGENKVNTIVLYENKLSPVGFHANSISYV